MSELPEHHDDETARQEAATVFMRANLSCPFGPSFFLSSLGRFVRDRCPDPKEHLPIVQLRLADGDTLDVCHIIGVSPRWVMVAVRDPASHGDAMAIELVPYELIRRVSIRTRRPESGTAGFSQTGSPQIIAAETLLQAAMPPAHDSTS